MTGFEIFRTQIWRTPPAILCQPRGMRRAVAVLSLLVLTGCATSSTGSSSSSGKSDTHAIDKPGCLDVGLAENTYNTAVTGVQDGTMTVADAAVVMGKVQKKLQDVALVASLPVVVAHAKTGAVHAGRIRVAFLGQGDADVKTEIAALTTDMQAADSACSA